MNDGALVTLEPVDPSALRPDDIVLVRVHGTDYLHLVKASDRGHSLIGNNRGGTNCWVGRHAIFGQPRLDRDQIDSRPRRAKPYSYLPRPG